MRQIKKFWGIMLIAAMLLAGCGGSMEDPESLGLYDALEEISSTVEDALDEAGESVEEALDEAGESVEEAPEDVGKSVEEAPNEAKRSDLPVEGEYYYDVKNVVLYLTLYDELPYNYITKKEAQNRGWSGGSVEDYVEDAAIGGDYFGNYEGILPGNQEYHECDIDTHGYKNRGSRRLIYSENGKFYYSKDHYESFTEITVDDDYNVDMNGERYE